MQLHVGVYAYRPEALDRYVATPVSELETLEGLEQLRFLAAGIPIAVVEVETPPFALARAQQPRGCRADRAGARRSGPGMSSLDALPERYRVILCDVWGVVHDGVKLYPGAAERLRQWRGEGRIVILITNAPRTAEAVEPQLERIGLPRDAWDGIATSGEAGIAALQALGRPVGFIGTAADRAILEGRGVAIADDDDFTDLACTGLDGRRAGRRRLSSAISSAGRRAASHMHCLNPDRLVIRGGVPEPCAGRDRRRLRGAWRAGDLVRQAAIRRSTTTRCTSPAIRRARRVLAVGDGLQTDILGAARMGFDARLRHRRNPRRRAVPGRFRRANTALATGSRWRSSIRSPR